MIEITNEDNMTLMARYPDKYFDLAIVDPPYGSSIMKKNKKQRHGTTDTTYRNKDTPNQEYFKELERVSKARIIFGCQYMLPFLSPEGSFIIWDKGADPDLHNMSACDVAWYSKRKQIKKYYAHWCGAVKCEKEPTIHIHQKPVKIYEWLLMNYAERGFKILDTHLGSGSIAIACHNLGFDLTACDIDKTYCERAIKRLDNHQKQRTIFDIINEQ
jgi:site-specific DNA-methyltransferase (adenine-specific)